MPHGVWQTGRVGLLVSDAVWSGPKRRHVTGHPGCWSRPGIAGQSEIIQYPSEIQAQSAQLFGDRLTVSLLMVPEHRQGEASEAGHVLGAVFLADQAGVLIECVGAVKDVVGGFDGPVFPVGCQNLFGGGRVFAQRGDAEGDLDPWFLFALGVGDRSFHRERESDMREADMVAEFVGQPDRTLLDSAMVLDRILDEVRRQAFRLDLKPVPGLHRLQQVLLVALDREVEVSAPAHDILGRFALGVHGVGGDGATADVDRLQYGDEEPDLIGLFLLLGVLHRQRADFFFHSSSRCRGRSR